MSGRRPSAETLKLRAEVERLNAALKTQSENLEVKLHHMRSEEVRYRRELGEALSTITRLRETARKAEDDSRAIESLQATLAARTDEYARLVNANADLGLKLQALEAEVKAAQRRENEAIGEATRLKGMASTRQDTIRSLSCSVAELREAVRRRAETIEALAARLGEAEAYRLSRISQDVYNGAAKFHDAAE